MEQNVTDEIDLGIVFNKIKQGFNNILISFFRGFQFILKHWWVIIILALVGGTTGYFMEKNREPNKETTLIVQNNFNSSNYVYEAIEQLNQKVKEKDTLYLKNAGFRIDTIVLKEILIAPIVNIIELLNKSRDTYRPLETFLDKASFEDELLTSELFFSEYKYHKINIKTSSKGTQNDINNVVDFLNDNEMFNQIKKVVVKETENRVASHKKTVIKIDAILESQANKDQGEESSSQLVISNGADYTDFYQLINSKNNSISQILNLKTELIKYDNIVTIINKPSLTNEKKFLSNHKVNFALLFVFLYVFFFLLKNMYYSIKELSENIDNNK